MPVKLRSRTNCCPRTVNASGNLFAEFHRSIAAVFSSSFVYATRHCKKLNSGLGQSRNESVILGPASRGTQEMTRRSWRKVVLKTKTQARVQTRQKLDYTHPLFLRFFVFAFANSAHAFFFLFPRLFLLFFLPLSFSLAPAEDVALVRPRNAVSCPCVLEIVRYSDDLLGSVLFF